MTRGGLARSNMLLLRRGNKRAESGLGNGKFLGSIHQGVGGKVVESSCCWVPHPRTGIYFPAGHEWVMDDVPEGAATFPHTCWFRNIDGVDHNPNPNPNPDAPAPS